MKLLLHACCGPCTLEPLRLLQEAGHELTIVYANSNIAPQSEYEHRLEVLRDFAQSQGVQVIEAPYNPEAWEATAGALGKKIEVSRPNKLADLDPEVLASAGSVAELLDDEQRRERCRLCYRQRLEEAAKIAAEGGYDTFSTTLAVSPYQFTDIIHEELLNVGKAAGVETYFEDWRPYYDRATERSREMGMYRQNYCGCHFSITEGKATRAFIKQQKAQQKAVEKASHAAELAAAEQERQSRKAEKAAYAEKQARKNAVLKALREQSKKEANE